MEKINEVAQQLNVSSVDGKSYIKRNTVEPARSMSSMVKGEHTFGPAQCEASGQKRGSMVMEETEPLDGGALDEGIVYGTNDSIVNGSDLKYQ